MSLHWQTIILPCFLEFAEKEGTVPGDLHILLQQYYPVIFQFARDRLSNGESFGTGESIDQFVKARLAVSFLGYIHDMNQLTQKNRRLKRLFAGWGQSSCGTHYRIAHQIHPLQVMPDNIFVTPIQNWIRVLTLRKRAPIPYQPRMSTLFRRWWMPWRMIVTLTIQNLPPPTASGET
ncbi:hypothetical protein L873DRAFT_712236 [Choiromyces venosus 120613-1]|uniref:Uncharacterized protein n=1 Tax=Choiromyces venosus 120613-1 TaxID=1336337 RepID=A0A3N4JXR5_9PEZI|nr:hypothetical protein L873DRAFT_712236 [Choiromyces venosus 120613-1]